MAKALLGHVGGLELRLVDEVRRLRRRVSDLEAEVVRLQIERDVLTAAVLEHHVDVDESDVSDDLADLSGFVSARAPAASLR
jgi:hypothetical protein